MDCVSRGKPLKVSPSLQLLLTHLGSTGRTQSLDIGQADVVGAERCALGQQSGGLAAGRHVVSGGRRLDRLRGQGAGDQARGGLALAVRIQRDHIELVVDVRLETLENQRWLALQSLMN